MKTQFFYSLFGHHTTSQMKGLQAFVFRFYLLLSYTIIQHNQIFLYFFSISKLIQVQTYIKINSIYSKRK